MSASAQDLRKIKTFEQLLPYLETELDWPLEDYGFDELTFEYAPEELGLKAEEAIAKGMPLKTIDEILAEIREDRRAICRVPGLRVISLHPESLGGKDSE